MSIPKKTENPISLARSLWSLVKITDRDKFTVLENNMPWINLTGKKM